MQETKNFTNYKLQVHDRILDAAMRDFAKLGIKATKMDDLAIALGISKRTIYEIFGTKEGLLFECIRRRHLCKTQEIALYAANHDVVDTVVHLYRASIDESTALTPGFYEELSKYPEIMRYQEQQKDRNQQNFLSFINRGINEGYFRSDINYEIITHVFDALQTYIHSNSLYQRYSVEDLFFNMLFVPVRGFCTPKGIQKLDRLFEESKG